MNKTGIKTIIIFKGSFFADCSCIVTSVHAQVIKVKKKLFLSLGIPKRLWMTKNPPPVRKNLCWEESGQKLNEGLFYWYLYKTVTEHPYVHFAHVGSLCEQRDRQHGSESFPNIPCFLN